MFGLGSVLGCTRSPLALIPCVPCFVGLPSGVTHNFTGFYWALLGFTGFYWVLLGNLGFTGINSTCILLDCFFCLDLHILLAYTGFYWVLLSSIGITGIYSKCTLLYCFFLDLRILLGFAGIY